MAAAAATRLSFAPLSFDVDPSFMRRLGERLLDEWQLQSDVRDIVGFFSICGGDSSAGGGGDKTTAATPALHLRAASIPVLGDPPLSQISPRSGEIAVPGELLIFHTVEAFRGANRTALAAGAVRRWARGGQSPPPPQFLVTCFADLKARTFVYWCAAPCPVRVDRPRGGASTDVTASDVYAPRVVCSAPVGNGYERRILRVLLSRAGGGCTRLMHGPIFVYTTESTAAATARDLGVDSAPALASDTASYAAAASALGDDRVSGALLRFDEWFQRALSLPQLSHGGELPVFVLFDGLRPSSGAAVAADDVTLVTGWTLRQALAQLALALPSLPLFRQGPADGTSPLLSPRGPVDRNIRVLLLRPSPDVLDEVEAEAAAAGAVMAASSITCGSSSSSTSSSSCISDSSSSTSMRNGNRNSDTNNLSGRATGSNNSYIGRISGNGSTNNDNNNYCSSGNSSNTNTNSNYGNSSNTNNSSDSNLRGHISSSCSSVSAIVAATPPTAATTAETASAAFAFSGSSSLLLALSLDHLSSSSRSSHNNNDGDDDAEDPVVASFAAWCGSRSSSSSADSTTTTTTSTTSPPPPTGIAFVGWELNAAGALGPRILRLPHSHAQHQTLADTASELNLSLMRWRMLPELNIALLRRTRVLLLGAGTLGCHLARDLLPWGFTHITLVDGGRVSPSNPVRQPLYEAADATADGGRGAEKAPTAAAALRRVKPGVDAVGVMLTIPSPGRPLQCDADAASALASAASLARLIAECDVVFLLTDSRESRWLPTLLAAAGGKTAITVALGFDSFLVMRHGVVEGAGERGGVEGAEGVGVGVASEGREGVGGGVEQGAAADTGDHSATNTTNKTCNSTASSSANNSAADAARSPRRLGCYFCTDDAAGAPRDSSANRTLDQQCSVTRPGVAPLACALAVELLVALLHHPDGARARHEGACALTAPTASPLGLLPHTLRCFVTHLQPLLGSTPASPFCTACSDAVRGAYAGGRGAFLLEAFNSVPGGGGGGGARAFSALERLVGLDRLAADAEAAAAGVIALDSGDWEY